MARGDPIVVSVAQIRFALVAHYFRAQICSVIDIIMSRIYLYAQIRSVVVTIMSRILYALICIAERCASKRVLSRATRRKPRTRFLLPAFVRVKIRARRRERRPEQNRSEEDPIRQAAFRMRHVARHTAHPAGATLFSAIVVMNSNRHLVGSRSEAGQSAGNAAPASHALTRINPFC